MPRPGWISISIPEDMIDEIKKLIEQNPHLGYTSTSAYVADALRRLFREHSDLVPRFLLVRIQENHIMLHDNKIGEDVTVHFKTGGVIHCDYCDVADCAHINYVVRMQFLKRTISSKTDVGSLPEK